MEYTLVFLPLLGAILSGFFGHLLVTEIQKLLQVYWSQFLHYYLL